MSVIKSLKESNKNFRDAIPLKEILKIEVTGINFNVMAQAISKYIVNNKVSRVNLTSDIGIKTNKPSGNNNLKYTKNKKEFRNGIINRRCS